MRVRGRGVARDRVSKVIGRAWELLLCLPIVNDLILNILEIAHLLLIIAIQARLPRRAHDEKTGNNRDEDQCPDGKTDGARLSRVTLPVASKISKEVEKGRANDNENDEHLESEAYGHVSVEEVHDERDKVADDRNASDEESQVERPTTYPNMRAGWVCLDTAADESDEKEKDGIQNDEGRHLIADTARVWVA